MGPVELSAQGIVRFERERTPILFSPLSPHGVGKKIACVRQYESWCHERVRATWRIRGAEHSRERVFGAVSVTVALTKRSTEL